MVDVDHQIQQFLDDHLPIEDWLFSRVEPSTSVANPLELSDAHGWCESPYPPLPPCKLNQLIWPTGASRFSRALFLVDKYSLLRIIQEAWNYTPPLDNGNPVWPEYVPDAWATSNQPVLVDFHGETAGHTSYMSDGMRFTRKGLHAPTVKFPMFVLPPLRVPGEGMDLFVLPLVCERYFMRHRIETLESYGTFNEVLDSLASKCSTSYALHMGPISSVYGTPDPSLGMFLLPVAKTLDLIAASLGLRVVFSSRKMRIVDDSYLPMWREYCRHLDSLVAGGKLGTAHAAYNLRIHHQNFGGVVTRTQTDRLHAAPPDGQQHPTSSERETLDVWSNWYPSYAASHQDYANQLADDLARWLDSGSLFSYANPIQYAPTGFDDYYSVEFWEDPKEPGRHIFRSRIQELPPLLLPKCFTYRAPSPQGWYVFELLENWKPANPQSGYQWPYAQARIKTIESGTVQPFPQAGVNAVPVYVVDPLGRNATLQVGQSGVCYGLGSHAFIAVAGGGSENSINRPAFLVKATIDLRAPATGGGSGSGGTDADLRGADASYAAAKIKTTGQVVLSPNPFNLYTVLAEVANPFKLNGIEGDSCLIGYDNSTATYFLQEVFPARGSFWFKLFEPRPNGLAIDFNVSRLFGTRPGLPGAPLTSADVVSVSDRNCVSVGARAGDVGYAIWSQQFQKYVIESCSHHATRIRGVTFSLGTGNTTTEFVITTQVGFDGPVPSTAITAKNLHNWAWPGVNKVARAEFNPMDGTWELYQLDCL